MTDAATLAELRSDSEQLFESQCGDLAIEAHKAGILAFISTASDEQLLKLYTERASGDIDGLVTGVCSAPAVLRALSAAINAIEQELHSTFPVAKEQG